MRATALRSTRIADADAYLRCFRYFDHAPEVAARKSLLEEQTEFDQAVNQNSKQALLDFVMNHPSSQLVENARRKIEDIEKGQLLHDYEGSELAGTQYKRGSVTDLSACRFACQKENEACAGYTYFDAQRACTLWGSVTRRTHDPAARSGARRPIEESAAPVQATAAAPTVAPPTPPPVTASGRFAYYPGYEYLRGDLTRVSPVDQEDCEERCGADRRCVAYVYQRAMGTCILKNEIIARAPNPDSVTALKQAVNAPDRSIAIYQDTDLANPAGSPADFHRIDLVELQDCVARCQQDGRCRAFTYNVARRVCWLKSSYQDVLSFPGAVSGIRR
jgi:hypothetical protein